MDVQLEIIKQLKDEIEKLNRNMHEIQLEYDDNFNKISSTFSEIQNLNDKNDNERNLFEKKCRRKMVCYICPVFAIISCFFGCILQPSLYNDVGILWSYVSSLIISMGIFTWMYNLYFSNVNIWYNYDNKSSQRHVESWRKFLFKKYPDLEKQFKYSRELIGQISKKEKEISVLKNQKIELECKLANISNLLNSKKDKLISLEGQYIDCSLNNSPIEEDKLVESQVFKKRILKPNDERY